MGLVKRKATRSPRPILGAHNFKTDPNARHTWPQYMSPLKQNQNKTTSPRRIVESMTCVRTPLAMEAGVYPYSPVRPSPSWAAAIIIVSPASLWGAAKVTFCAIPITQHSCLPLSLDFEPLARVLPGHLWANHQPSPE